jgi:NAD(H)-dependent 7alpha-hydroxy-3-oxo-delta4-cholenoic acid oxidoreductase
MSYDALFSPIKIRGLELKNRVLMPGMNTKMVKDKNDISDDMVAYHAARAAGGCGLNILEVVAVSPATHAYLYMGLYTEHHRDELKKVTDAIHANGGKAGVQLWHGGFVPEAFLDKTCKLQTPDNTTVEDIHEIVAAYGHSAKLAVEAGFDMVEYHAAHTYIPHEFLNPCLNNRTDEYGGSFENRCRFPLECIKAIRENIPEDMPLFMRLDAIDEMMPKNMTQDEIVEFINMAADAGVDLVDLSRGNARSNATVYEVPPYNLEPGFNMDNISAVKARVKIPVAGVGRINTPELANRLVEEGKLDMVAVGRAQLVDPEWCNKAREGRDAEIRKCIACTQGCYDAVIDPKAKHITCTRNPMLCLEYKGLEKTDSPKKVMIIGGGMAGLVTAEFLKKRGHNPIVFEATDTLGGQMLLAGVAPKKQEFTAAAVWEGEEAKRMGIEIRMNTPVTPELIEKEKPDHVVIAIGSDYTAPEIPGLDGKDVYTQYQVLRGEVKPTGNVVILGGGGVGSEVAQHLAVNGAQPVILDTRRVGNGMGMLRKMFMDLEFPGYGIKRVSFAKVTEVGDHVVKYKLTDKKTKAVTNKERPFDALVVCTGIGSRPSDELQAKCTELGIPFDVIGDAKSARMALDATAEAYKVGTTI